jgi:uncharacterized SAM-binding protein YcdF (DUF218 family)
MIPSETASPIAGAGVRAIRVRLGLLALLLPLLGAVVWFCHEPLLNSLGRFVVEESPLAPSDLVVVLADNEVPAAAAAADIVRRGYATRILVFKSSPAEKEALLDRLGISVPTRLELAIIVMGRMGIAPGNIVVEPITETGTNGEVRAVARYARSHGASRIIAITYRSHTRRAAVLLRGALGRSSEVIVRATPGDPFEADGWWRDRGSCREFLIEGMRWANSFWFGDFWRDRG